MRKGSSILKEISIKYDRKLWKLWRMSLFMTLGVFHKAKIKIRFWVKVVLKRFFRNIYIAIFRRISAHGQKIIDIERRERKLFKKRGSVSFFLKDIVNHKKVVRK